MKKKNKVLVQQSFEVDSETTWLENCNELRAAKFAHENTVPASEWEPTHAENQNKTLKGRR